MEVNSNNELEMAPVLSPEPSRKKPLIIGLIIALVFVCGAVYAYKSLDVFKSQKQIYAELEVKNFQQLEEKLTKAYEAYYDNYLGKYLNNPFQQNVEFSISLQGVETGDPDVDLLLDLLQKSQFSLTQKAEYKKDYLYANIDWAFENNKILGFEFLQDKNKMGFKVPLLYDKYVFVDLNEHDSFKEKYGEEIPKKIIQNRDILEALDFKAKDAKIFYAYGRLLLDSISEEQVAIKEGATFSEGDFKLNDCREITVVFGGNQLLELERKLQEKLANDEDLVNLLYDKWNSIYKLYEEAGYIPEGEMTELFTKEDIKDALESIAGESSATIPEGLKMVLYVDQKDQILERRFVPLDETKSQTMIRCAAWTDQQNRDNWLLLLKDFVPDEPGEVRITNQSTPFAENGKKGTLVLSIKGSTPTDVFTWENDYSYQSDEIKEAGEWKFAVSDAQTEIIKGEIKTDIDKNKKEKSEEGITKGSLSFSVPYDELQDDITIAFEAKHSEIVGKSFDHVKLDKNNAVNLITMTENEMMAIYQDVQNNLMQFIMDNQALISQLELL